MEFIKLGRLEKVVSVLIKKKKMETVKQISITLLILIVSTFLLSSQEQENEDCASNVYPEKRTIELGALFAGKTNGHLPGPGGTDNSTIFRLIGSSEKEYQVNTHLTTTINSGEGSIQIDKWRWTYINYSNGSWTGTYIDNNQVNDIFKLYQPPGANKCDSYIRFKLILDQITVTPDAKPGSYSINALITVSITNI